MSCKSASETRGTLRKAVCVLLQSHYDMDIRVRRKAEALIEAGYAVDVLALRGPGRDRKAYSLNGVQVHTISLGKERGSLGRYVFKYVAFLVWSLFKVRAMMEQRQYTVVDVNNLPDFLVFGAWCAKRRGARVVFDMHEITPEFFMSKYGVGDQHWLVRLCRRIERACLRYADHVIAINEPIQRLLEQRGLPAGKCTIVMNSADEGLFQKSSACPTPPDPSEGRATYVMMYHGTLTRIYGLDIALESFALAQETLPGAEFWILGRGPEQDYLESQARRLGLEGKVRFLGSVPPGDIAGWLRRCDVGVLPTRQDVFLDLSFSNKLSEYIISDKAVIVSRLRTIRHYFSEEALAFFKPHDVNDLARQMSTLYHDPALRSRLAARARENYRPLCWAVMKQRYVTAVNCLAGAKDVGLVDQLPVGVSKQHEERARQAKCALRS